MINIQNLSKTYKGKNKKNVKIFSNISLKIKNGEFIVFFGPNGCGKSTLLNIISGIEKPDKGNITINNKKPSNSKIGFVFQNYNDSMLPWRTVENNIKLPLEVKNISDAQSKLIIKKLLKNTELYNYKDKYFYELSGGQKQLTAIYRAFVHNPDILLLDEPFNSLDYSTSNKIRFELLKIWKETKKTTIFVSHDIDEAILLADKVVVLSSKPTKIKGIVKINLPRPRKLNIIASKDFFRLRNKIINLFEYGN